MNQTIQVIRLGVLLLGLHFPFSVAHAAQTCTAPVGALGHGVNAVVADSIGPEVGSATVTCNDGVYNYSATTCVAGDTTPNAFGFTDVTGQALNMLITSNTITISGINAGTAVSVSGDGSPQISINGGAWGTSGTITNGQSLAVRLTSANANSTARTATVDVGGVTDVWSVTTGAGCTTRAETWTQGANSCNGSTPALSHGASTTVTDGTGTTGSVTMTCTNGSLSQSGATCSAACIPNFSILPCTSNGQCCSGYCNTSITTCQPMAPCTAGQVSIAPACCHSVPNGTVGDVINANPWDNAGGACGGGNHGGFGTIECTLGGWQVTSGNCSFTGGDGG